MILFTLPCGRVVVNIRDRETPPKNQKLIFMAGHIVMFPGEGHVQNVSVRAATEHGNDKVIRPRVESSGSSSWVKGVGGGERET